MPTTCPNCHDQLPDPAVECDNCGHQIHPTTSEKIEMLRRTTEPVTAYVEEQRDVHPAKFRIVKQLRCK